MTFKNDEQVSNFSLSDLDPTLKGSKAYNTLHKNDKLASSGTPDSGTPIPTYTPPPVSETLILGMHPMTLGFVAGGILITSILGIVAYKYFKK